MKNIKTLIRLLAVLSGLFVLVGPQLGFVVLAAALPPGELKALNDYPNWLGQESTCSADTSPSPTPTTLPGGDNTKTIFDYFIGKGLSPIAAAGIVGNFAIESGADPTKQQDKSSDPFPKDGVGFGIAQWTFSARQDGLVALAKQENKPVTDLGVQLDYVWQELTGGYRQVLGHLKTATSADDAARIFQGDTLIGGTEPGYEAPQDERASLDDRQAAARLALKNYGGDAGSIPTTPGITASNNCTSTVCGTITGGATTVVLDPGHGPNFSQVDAATGLNMVESHNVPEITEVWNVSQKVKTALENAGYKVLLTKQDIAGDGVTFRDRATVANNAKAAIAVSIHDDHSQSYGSFKQVYDQEVGEYRGSGVNKTIFSDAAVAKLSTQYSQIFSAQRQKAEGGTVQVTKDTSFSGRAGLETGDIPMVQLFSKVPWVYNEVGASDNLTGAQQTAYANGIIAAVEQSVPITSAQAASDGEASNADTCGVTGTGPSAIVSEALNYAWKDNRGDNYCIERPTYKAAIDAAAGSGGYIGADCDSSLSAGLTWHGIDCGAFVTRVVVDSGADPGYNYGGKLSAGASNTVYGQKPYLDANSGVNGKYQNLGAVTSTTQLQPGDIAINSQHTFIYMGQQAGFAENAASASQGTRSPMARPAYFASPNGEAFTWYRLKG